MPKEKKTKKPKAKVVGQNKNIFNLLSICMTSLRKSGLHEKSQEMQNKILASSDYDESIKIMSEYCELY